MAGFDMMLKQLLGIDPAELKKQFENATDTLGRTLAHFDARLSALETQQKETNALLLRIATALEIGDDDNEREHGTNGRRPEFGVGFGDNGDAT